MIGTIWQHKTGPLKGTVTEHDPKTGRVRLKLNNGRTYKGQVNNLKAKWQQVKAD